MTATRAKTVLVVAVAGLIAYGSLYPFQFQAPSGTGAELARFFSHWGSDGRLTDLLDNIALFFPLGFVLAYRTRAFGPSAVILRVVVWGGFALLLQLAQLWLPDRIAAMNDVAWNVVGLLAGTVAARFVGRVPFDARVPLLPLALLALWVVAEASPLVPALGWQEFKDSLKPLLLSPHFDLAMFLMQFAMALAVGRLIQTLPRWGDTVSGYAGVLFGVVLLQLVVVHRAVELSTLVAFGAAFVVWRYLLRGRRTQLTWLVGALVLAFTFQELAPMDLAIGMRSFHWIPFEAALRGNMLNAVITFSTLLFVFASALYFILQSGGRIGAASVALSLWVFLLEFAQTMLVGRTPDITPALLVILAGAMVSLLARQFLPVRTASVTEPNRKRSVGTRAWPAETSLPLKVPVSLLLGTAFAMAVGMNWLTGLANVPYNIRELFLGPSWIYPFVFSLSVLWLGFGSALMAIRLTRTRRPYLELPFLLLTVCLVSLLLLSVSVTDESIMDIAGSNNLNWFVIHKEIWGQWAAHWFRAMDAPGLVAFFERPARYAALIGPLVLSLALFGVLYGYGQRDGQHIGKWMLLVLAALPVYLLCKAIAFDWSSTDNLNELLARDAALGMGGGAYLYGLLLLFSWNVVVVATSSASKTRLVTAAIGSLVALPLSWWLLNHGLGAQINKYGSTFSGAQFLLGPDRKHVLPTEVLLLRWGLVYLGGLAVLSVGYWSGKVLVNGWSKSARSSRNAGQGDESPIPRSADSVRRMRDTRGDNAI